MAITTYAGMYTGAMQVFPFTKVDTTASAADNPTMTYGWGGRPSGGSSGASLSGTVQTNTTTGCIPFKNAASGQSTYLSGFAYNGSNVTNGRSLYVIDLIWATSAVSQVTTTQTINSVSLPARDMDGTTNGRGVYIAMWHTVSYSGSNAYTATITYTNSAGTTSRVGTVSRSGGAVNRWVPFGLQNGDEGVRSVQDFTFSALPGTSGVTALIAYRPIAVIASQYSMGNATVKETGMTLGLPVIYDNSCLTTINLAYSYSDSSGVYTLSQG